MEPAYRVFVWMADCVNLGMLPWNNGGSLLPRDGCHCSAVRRLGHDGMKGEFWKQRCRAVRRQSVAVMRILVRNGNAGSQRARHIAADGLWACMMVRSIMLCCLHVLHAEKYFTRHKQFKRDEKSTSWCLY